MSWNGFSNYISKALFSKYISKALLQRLKLNVRNRGVINEINNNK